MKICFLHPGGMLFNMDTPFQQALGGTESALVYLAIQIAELGHQVTLLSNTAQSGFLRGVTNLNYKQNTNAAFFHRESFDLVVVINACRMSNDFKSILPAHSKLAVWITLDADQPPVQPLLQSTIRNEWDFFILISEYQRARFVNYLHLPLEKCVILRNAISPNFENLFSSVEELAAAKYAQGAPRLAYTSTPFRGLEILMDLYPEFEHQFPAARLQVYSNMNVYQITDAQQEPWLLELYERCRNARGVDYIGSIPQPELARALRSVSILAYPCTFAETSCIAVMEAMASGCLVVT
ncbi:MAG: glycosyltransferase family 4 protein, partial [Chloroflexota bacterium]